MKNCLKCIEENRPLESEFQVIGRTFYKISKDVILCHRHWHQLKQPDYKLKGYYFDILQEPRT
jgi:hypothetical protein